MLDFSHIPGTSLAEVQQFTGQYQSGSGVAWQTWQKPRGKTMCNILLLGKGGDGGTGVIGANSVSAGGGGGGSGAQTSLTLPLWAIPDTLFISLCGRGSAGINSYVSIAPNNTANNILAAAASGGKGGNATAGTGGAAGAAGSVSTASGMPLGFQWADALLVGQAGIIGGAAIAGGNLTLPVTGLLATGGTGGGGLPAAAATGTNGGSITGAGLFPTVVGGIGSATATDPARSGSHGGRLVSGVVYHQGGTGGASTHGTATGAGLQQSSGGDGGFGCGGGGMGGALTGSAAGVVGLGGDALCIITCW